MDIQHIIKTKVKQGFLDLYHTKIPTVEIQATRKNFEGDITVVLYSLLSFKKIDPLQMGNELGGYLVQHNNYISRYNIVKGFLNLVVANDFYLDFFNQILADEKYGFAEPNSLDAHMVEYSSPNTNKPLHLGHIRNVLLGYSVAEILKAIGHKVYKTQIVNDRGIHICKSMLAWKKYGNGETPKSAGLKGDKLVGNYYIKFNEEYSNQVDNLTARGLSEDDAKKQAPLLLEAQELLRSWEKGDIKTVALWKKMNTWVYKGFNATYEDLGVDFDKLYYESNTYLLGKDIIKEGLVKGVFFKKDDASVWCNLTEYGLDEKLVLRSDGTAVYITQDLGTAVQRAKDFTDLNGMIYTVGNEQDYHFKVLFLILKKLGYPWAEQLHHLSYGMVDLPSGKMKSREGTVVDADDLISEMTKTAKYISEQLGKLEGYSKKEKNYLYKIIGLGALKYFILKVDPKKRILFNPEASVDFQGNTGSFIQYTYARIQSILRKVNFNYTSKITGINLHEKERKLNKQLGLFPETIKLAAKSYSPAIIANYTYDLVKEFNSFYQNVPILAEENTDKKIFRVQLAKKVAKTIKLAFKLLGIEVPKRM
ncbi:MAG: arginine--tRNA ligase [Tenacibaculum sp.]